MIQSKLITIVVLLFIPIVVVAESRYLAFVISNGIPSPLRHQNRPYSTTRSVTYDDEHSQSVHLPNSAVVIKRRKFVSIPGVIGSGFFASLLFPKIVLGTTTTVESNSTTTGTTLSATDIANLLHAVPTFTIVDTDGIPYMVVGEDARVTGYFFTSYTEAQRILNLAKTSVDQSIRDEVARLKLLKVTTKDSSIPELDSDLLKNPWISARISTIPLDVAITLSLKGLNGNVRNYFQVAAAETDIDDALKITDKKDLAEGKVPLFYYADFTVDTKIPLYFQKDQLIMAYRKQHPKPKPLPAIQVTELFAVLTTMVQAQQKSSNNNDQNDLQNLIFVPPINSEQWVQQCTRNNGGKAPYVLGKRNIVL